MRTFSTVVLGLLIAAGASASPEKAPAPATAPAPAAAPAPAQGAASPAAAAGPAYYRIDLAPSGNYVAIGAPVEKPGSVTFHAYPDGKLMMLRRSDVKKVSQITAKEAAGPANKDLVSIGNLAMQGGSAPAAGGGGGGRPATGAPGSVLHGPQGAALVPSRDGIAVTLNPATVNQGPSVVNMPDGVGVVSAPPAPAPNPK